MSLAKITGGPRNQSSSSGTSGTKGSSASQRSFPKWKTTNQGSTIEHNNKTYNWCKWHKRYVLSHDSNSCKENPSHPDYAEFQKQKENWDRKNQPELEMNFLKQEDEEYTPVNPWITLASTGPVPVFNDDDIAPAIPLTTSEKKRKAQTNNENHQDESKSTSRPSFWAFSSWLLRKAVVFGLSSALIMFIIYLLILAPITIRYYLLFLGFLAHSIHCLNIEDESITKSETRKKTNSYNDTFPESFCIYSSIQIRNHFLFQCSKNQHLKHLAIDRIILNHLVDISKCIIL